jgi:hypothetical protein
MLAIIYLLGTFIADLFKSRRRLEVENLFLRHQLNITLRRPQRRRLRGSDRALMVWMTRRWPSLLILARVVQPATILRWHRAGFRTYWRRKSQGWPGRPRIEHDLRDLIRRTGSSRLSSPCRTASANSVASKTLPSEARSNSESEVIGRFFAFAPFWPQAPRSCTWQPMSFGR